MLLVSVCEQDVKMKKANNDRWLGCGDRDAKKFLKIAIVYEICLFEKLLHC